MINDNPYAAPQASLAPPTPSAGDLPLATYGQRFVNSFVDGIALNVLQYAVAYMLAPLALEVQSIPVSFYATAFRLMGIFLWIVIFLGYYVVMEASTGQTIGKLLTGTKVIADGGGPPRLGRFSAVVSVA